MWRAVRYAAPQEAHTARTGRERVGLSRRSGSATTVNERIVAQRRRSGRAARLPLCAALLLLATACVPGPSSSSSTSATPMASRSALACVSPTVAASESPLPPESNVLIAAVQRLDTQVGYIVGPAGGCTGIFKTSDGGTNWQRLARVDGAITGVRFIDQQVGWARAEVMRDVPRIGCRNAPPGPCRGLVLRTLDGGRTWQEVLSIPTQESRTAIWQLQAVDGQVAWVLTVPPSACPSECRMTLRRTTDGGATWTSLLEGELTAIRFASASRGWVALIDPDGTVEVRATSDGGNTWTTGRRLTTRGSPTTLDAATTQTAWLLVTDWTSCSASTCGTYELFRTDDGGLSWSSLGNPKDSVGSCGFGQLVGPVFASLQRGWLALNLGAGGGSGPGGLLTTEDGGKTWSCSSTTPNTELISAADPLHVWVTSEKRGPYGGPPLYSTDDGGRTWHPLNVSGLR